MRSLKIAVWRHPQRPPRSGQSVSGIQTIQLLKWGSARRRFRHQHPKRQSVLDLDAVDDTVSYIIEIGE